MKEFALKLVSLTYMVLNICVLMAGMIMPFHWAWGEPEHKFWWLWMVYPLCIIVIAAMESPLGRWANKTWNDEKVEN